MSEIAEMDGPGLRAEAVATLSMIVQLSRRLRDLREYAGQLEARLLNGEGVKLAPSEGVASPLGTLKRHKEQSGRSFVVTDEVDKDKGELPTELQPVEDKRVVIEHLSLISAGIAAELLALAEADPFKEGGEDPPVVVKPKVKYPTVAKLRAAFGDETKYVGKPAAVESLVLEIPSGDPDKPYLVGKDGLV